MDGDILNILLILSKGELEITPEYACMYEDTHSDFCEKCKICVIVLIQVCV